VEESYLYWIKVIKLEQIFGKYFGGIFLIIGGITFLTYAHVLVDLSIIQKAYLLPVLLSSIVSPILGLWLMGSRTWIFEKGVRIK